MDRNGCKVSSFQCFFFVFVFGWLVGFVFTFFLHFERGGKALHAVILLWEQIGSHL